MIISLIFIKFSNTKYTYTRCKSVRNQPTSVSLHILLNMPDKVLPCSQLPYLNLCLHKRICSISVCVRSKGKINLSLDTFVYVQKLSALQ